jgi:hypothetical protein
MYKITVRAVGNPDHGQDPDKPLFGVDPKTIKAESLDELQEAVWDWQIDNAIGAGNWVDMPVYEYDHCIGLMSYNGRIWEQK